MCEVVVKRDADSLKTYVAARDNNLQNFLESFWKFSKTFWKFSKTFAAVFRCENFQTLHKTTHRFETYWNCLIYIVFYNSTTQINVYWYARGKHFDFWQATTEEGKPGYFTETRRETAYLTRRQALIVASL